MKSTTAILAMILLASLACRGSVLIFAFSATEACLDFGNSRLECLGLPQARRHETAGTAEAPDGDRPQLQPEIGERLAPAAAALAVLASYVDVRRHERAGAAIFYR